MSDSYREHIERRRAERNSSQQVEVAIDNGLRVAAAEAGVGEMPVGAIEPMRTLVMRTQELTVGQCLVLGVYLTMMAGTVIDAKLSDTLMAGTVIDAKLSETPED